MKHHLKPLLLLSVLLSTQALSAQEKTSNWYFGLGEGFHTGNAKFSEVNSNLYHEKKNIDSPVFSLFVQYEFGAEHQFSVRPEIAWLNRGGKINGYKIYDLGDNETSAIADYRLKSHYFDIRIPFAYSFLKSNSTFRPYLFVVPIIGLSTGGNIRMQSEQDNDEYYGVRTNLSNANINSTYFALAPGLGLRYNFHAGKQGQHRLFVSLEASYEFGLTDTYGKDEKNGSASDLLGNTIYKLEGTRKFSGIEIKAVLGIPFSVFEKKKPKTIVITEKPAYVDPDPISDPEPIPAIEEKLCYDLDEIIGLMSKGEDITGKTICAIDDINFDFGKSDIKPQSYTYLDKLAVTLIRTNANIKVNGHTDNIGNDDFNMNLSKDRAIAVMNYLVKKGVASHKISYGYYGAQRPLAENDTEEGRKLNRRVEFEILK